MVCSEDAAATLDGPSHPTQIKTLFVFPTNHALRKIWISEMNLINFEVKSHSRLCQDHFEVDQFEVSPKFIASLGLEGIKRPTLKSDAVPTIFYRGSPKGSKQVKGKISFKRRPASTIESKFQSKFQPSSPKKLSPKKRNGAFFKRRRLEVCKRFPLFILAYAK